MVSAPARRIAALYAVERGIPQRRACALMQVARSSLHYVPTLPQKNAPIANAMQRLSGQYPRYGSRRIRVFLKREGIEVGKDKCSRLWAEQGLQVPKKRPRHRVTASLAVDCGRWRRHRQTRCGATTSCSMPAPTASRSNA